jgi:hypothetical protein
LLFDDKQRETNTSFQAFGEPIVITVCIINSKEEEEESTQRHGNALSS